MRRLVFVVAACALAPWLPSPASAQSPANPESAAVDFGVFPTGPLGPAPCLPVGSPIGPIGGPTDPCSYKLHILTPEETTVQKGGEVTFQIHGGGHGFAIYEVSPDTTRDSIGQQICAGPDPATIADPAQLSCNLSALNANARHIVTDGRDNVVLVAEENTANTHPHNRVWSEPGRLVSSGAMQFLNGGTTATNGQLITYRFLKTGRYLVLCMNRAHFLNDWMFGFVDVVGGQRGGQQ
jgi:plastocyanin